VPPLAPRGPAARFAPLIGMIAFRSPHGIA